MTIRFVQQWNGYSPDTIVTLAGAEETRLIGLGYAVTDLDGPGNTPLPVTSTTNLTRRLKVSASGVDVGAEFGRKPRSYFPLVSNIRVADAVTLQSCTVADVTRRTPSGMLMNGVKITPTAAAIGIAHFVLEPRTIASELVGFLFYVDVGENADLKFYLDDNATPTASFYYDWQDFQPGWKFVVPGRVSAAHRAGKWR